MSTRVLTRFAFAFAGRVPRSYPTTSLTQSLLATSSSGILALRLHSHGCKVSGILSFVSIVIRPNASLSIDNRLLRGHHRCEARCHSWCHETQRTTPPLLQPRSRRESHDCRFRPELLPLNPIFSRARHRRDTERALQEDGPGGSVGAKTSGGGGVRSWSEVLSCFSRWWSLYGG